MKTKILLLTLLFSTLIFSQNLEFYNLQGEKIYKGKEAITIKTFETKYFNDYKFIYTFSVSKNFYNNTTNSGILAIMFQEFTKKPLFVLGNKPTIKQINEAIASFDYITYIKSWEFNNHIKNYISDNNLFIEDLYKSFGKPNKETNTSEYTFFEYNFPNLYFTIKNGKVIDYMFIKPD